MAGQYEEHNQGVGLTISKPEMMDTRDFSVESQTLEDREAKQLGISRKGRGVSLI
jgi:hypothetical protein